MAKFFICRRDGSLKECQKWASEAIKHMREEEGFGFPEIKIVNPTDDSDGLRNLDYVLGLYYECSDEKEKELMDKYGWKIGQEKEGIHFMESI